MNYQTQKKILEPILKSSSNHRCADCNAASPTWASLDFGVFLCSNCSGAHRALGPTVTRVRSATLDLWQEEWIDNMLVGNEELNAYWQGDPRCFEKKPKWGASNQDIARYVYEKYVKRRYVKDTSKPDPLRLYKQRKLNPQANLMQDEKPQLQEPIFNAPKSKTPIAPSNLTNPVKKSQDLIDFSLDPSPVSPQIEVHSVGHCFEVPLPPGNNPIHQGSSHQMQSEHTLTNRTEHGTSFTSQNSGQNFISFDEMMNSHKASSNPVAPPLMHSLSSQHVHRPTFTVPHIQTHLPVNHLNHYQQQHYHNNLYPHSPQPQIHHYGQPQPQNGHNAVAFQQNLSPPYWH